MRYPIGTTCSVDGCERPVRSRGWCHAHYERWRKPRVAFRPCTIDGCERTVSARGWCLYHYSRWYRQQVIPELCTIDGCESPQSARGWCNRHYKRWEIYGDPTAQGVGRGRRRRRDDIGYSGAHVRVRADLGSPSTYSCVNCGARAQEWAYDHSDPDERVSSKWRVYSVKVEHYKPMCLSCHRLSDWAHSKSNTVVP